MAYLEYVELFQSIGSAIRQGKKGEDVSVVKNMSVNGRKKIVSVTVVDA